MQNTSSAVKQHYLICEDGCIVFFLFLEVPEVCKNNANEMKMMSSGLSDLELGKYKLNDNDKRYE